MRATQYESPHKGPPSCVHVGHPWRGSDTTGCTYHSCHLSVGVNTAERAIRAAFSPQLRHLRKHWEQGRHSEEGSVEFVSSVSSEMRMDRGARGAQPSPISAGIFEK